VAERYVVALGGNALIPPGGKGTADEQTRTVAQAMSRLAPLAGTGAEVVITHGNGPQVGNLLLKNELARDLVPPMPLDWCVAQTQATIGLAIQTALEWELHHRQIDRSVVVVLTRVEVDPLDPARLRYTKPIGRTISAEEAQAAADETHRYAEQPGGGWRRVPVETGEDGRYFGVEAVIDKDLTASLLARRLQADALIILTGAPGAIINYGKPGQRLLERVTPTILRGFQAAGHFAEGSMGPKVEGALRFVESGGRRAVIASLDEAVEAIGGEEGTQLVRVGGAAC
jgi:carbamate kinase